jgi:predicted RNase H-like nuclease
VQTCHPPTLVRPQEIRLGPGPGRAELVTAVGVDACRGGWVAAVLDGGRLAEIRVTATLAEIVDGFPDAGVIGVDMPLGLVERGWRAADRLAAARLGARRSRLFMVPPRAAWAAGTYPDAVAACRRLTDPPAGFSRQAWGLKDKLAEAGRLRDRQPGRLSEVHPEISFAELNGGTPVAASKKTWNGQMTRRGLLGGAGIHLPDDLAEAGAVPADDILDAAAVAWTAARIASGRAASLPSPPQPDDTGRPIAIWY